MSGVTMAGIAIGMGASMLMSQMSQPDAPAAAPYQPTPPPAVPAPTPMATPVPIMSAQKKTEQRAAISSAGSMTPQATLLSGNERRSVLGG